MTPKDPAHLRRQLANLPLALVEWDGDGRVVGYSRSAEELLGFAPDEVLGKGLDEVPWVLEEDRGRAGAATREAWAGDGPASACASRSVRKDGSVVPCEWHHSAVRDASGRLLSVLSLVLEVTGGERGEGDRTASGPGEGGDRHAAEARFEALARFPEENPDPVLRLSPDLHVSYANPAARASLALHPGAAAPPALAEMARRVLRDRARAKGELEAGGTVFSLSLVPVGSEVNVYGQDVTARKAAERALQAANERLREEDRRKDEFLAMLSHELRNPLAPIRNAVAILDRAPPGELAERARGVIARQVVHLSRLVDDLLDVTRIARGKIELRWERLDLVEVVRRAAEDHHALLDGRGVALALDLPDGPAHVRADAARLTQVFGNLLQNAAKFTARGGRVAVALASCAGARAEVRVVDTGIGIAPDLLDRIFDPFVQADQSLARTEGGLGLGLALVKAIVELHGGTVEAESEGHGRGARFLVRLPLAGEG